MNPGYDQRFFHTSCREVKKKKDFQCPPKELSGHGKGPFVHECCFTKPKIIKVTGKSGD